MLGQAPAAATESALWLDFVFDDLVPGDAQEDIVERRAAQIKLGDMHGFGVQQAHDFGDALRAAFHGDDDMPARLVRLRILATEGLQQLGGFVGVVGVGDSDVDEISRHIGFELVSRAFGDDFAVVDDDDVVRQFVGFFQVLGGQQQRGAVGYQLADGLPHGDARAGVQAGGRLIQEEHAGTGDHAGGEIQPAAHAPGIGLDQSVAGVGERELL